MCICIIEQKEDIKLRGIEWDEDMRGMEGRNDVIVFN